MAHRPNQSKAAPAGGPNQNVSQANIRRALGDIGNIVGNVAKEGANGKPVPHPSRPVTRSFGAQLLANAQAATSKGTAVDDKQSQGGAVNRPKKTGKDKDLPPIADVKDEAEDDDVVIIEPVHRVRPPRNRNAQAASRRGRPQTLTATLTARSEAFCSEFDAEMAEAEVPLPNIDEGDLNNQLAVVEYVEDIYNFYRKIEFMSCVPDYIQCQLEINDRMRAILIDWLIEVHSKFELMPETLYLTTNLLDRFLSLQQVTRKNLQLVGITAMLLASKYEEIWAPEINDFVCIADRAYTRQQILLMEKTMLNTLKFFLTVPTPYVFIVRFLKAADSDKQMENLVFFLTELSLLQYVMIKYSPSLLAAGAVYTARCTLKKEQKWTDLLKHHTGYSEVDFMECARFMVAFHRHAAENKLKTVHTKYAAPEFDSVALLSPARLSSQA